MKGIHPHQSREILIQPCKMLQLGISIWILRPTEEVELGTEGSAINRIYPIGESA